MQPEPPLSPVNERHFEIAHLIRKSYTDLCRLLHSPYVDGHEIHRCLVALGHNLSGDNSEIVSEALGWKCMRLPVANVEGKPKHYLPLAMPTEKTEAAGISSQTAVFVRNLRKFGQPLDIGLGIDCVS